MHVDDGIENAIVDKGRIFKRNPHGTRFSGSAKRLVVKQSTLYLVDYT